MKKIFLVFTIFTSLSFTTAYAQNATNLDTAIQEVVDYLDTRLPARSIVAVLNVKSDNQALSGFIINELVNTILNKDNLIPVDREYIDDIQVEQQLHLSGYVSDETAQSIGKMLGAQTIISGEIIAINNKMFRIDIKAISVETAAIQGTISKNIVIDKKMKAIMGSEESFHISLGGGAYIGGSFATGTREEDGKQGVGGLMRNYTITETNSASALNLGGFVFVDLKYAEMSVSMFKGTGNSQYSWSKYFSNNVAPSEENKTTGNFTALLINIGILGKYPFYLNNITLYPALGADYQFWARHTENGKTTPGDLSANNALWLKLGGGIDYRLNKSFFLRGELLWAAKLPTKNERDDSFTWFTHSPSAHIGIGYVVGK